MNKLIHTTVFASALAAAVIFAGSADASTRGATNAAQARQAFVQQDSQAYALTGEQVRQPRASKVSHNIQGGRNAG